MGPNRTPSNTPTVLLVDPENVVSDRFEESGHEPPFQFRVESELERARTELAAAAIDIVVFNPDPLDDATALDFVNNLQTIAPDCPLILFTKFPPDEVAEDLVAQSTTLVERSDEPGNWRFLIEKIRSNLQTTPKGNNDEEMYRMLVETARDGLYRLDRNGNVIYANESWAEMLGYDRSEVLGMHASQAMAEGELKSGQRIIQQVLADDDRESDIIDVEMVSSDGDQFTVAVHFVVLTTEDGAYDGVMGVIRDVTEQRATERELERKNEQLNQFVNTVSHDLRNPLNVARGRMELAREECDSEHLAPIDRSLRRMDTLIEDLLTLAKQGKKVSEMELVNLEEVIEQSWRNVETAEATLRIQTQRGTLADRGRLQHLFENLIRNAIEHGGPDVTVTVGELPDGFYVADDGPGIPEEDREGVFEAGYSTSDEGTGFGLGIVKQVVEAHDWEIRVGEGSEEGARFEITGVEFASE